MHLKLSDKYKTLTKKGNTVKNSLCTWAIFLDENFNTLTSDQIVESFNILNLDLPKRKRDLVLLESLLLVIINYFWSNKMNKASKKIKTFI